MPNADRRHSRRPPGVDVSICSVQDGNTLLLELLHLVNQKTKRPAQLIEPRHNHRVAHPQLIEHPCKRRPIRPCTAADINEDPGTAGSSTAVPVLVRRRHPRESEKITPAGDCSETAPTSVMGHPVRDGVSGHLYYGVAPPALIGADCRKTELAWPSGRVYKPVASNYCYTPGESRVLGE